MSGPSLFDDFFNEEEEKNKEIKKVELDKGPLLAEIKEQHSIQDEEKEYHEISEDKSKYTHNQDEQQENQTEKETISNFTSQSEIENHAFYFEMPSQDASSELEYSNNNSFDEREDISKKEDKNLSVTIEEVVIAEDEFEIEVAPGNATYPEINKKEAIESENEKRNLEESIAKELDTGEEEKSNVNDQDPQNLHFSEADLSIFVINEEEESVDLDEEIKEENRVELEKHTIEKELKDENFIQKDLKEQLPEFALPDKGQSTKYIPKDISESELPKWKLEKKYYSISEVAEFFNVNISHIRYWTNEFKLKPRTTRRGERLYSPEDINKLRMIYFLVKEQRYTIEGARNKLKQSTQAVAEKIDLKKALLGFKNQLEELLNSI
ncbi:MAG TPA: MerR family transcriptional regulator [Chitinophagaceae bacterium]|nr:MerR family transcriptional regulator [Chitinophagaceae bacterium]